MPGNQTPCNEAPWGQKKIFFVCLGFVCGVLGGGVLGFLGCLVFFCGGLGCGTERRLGALGWVNLDLLDST